MFSAGNGGFYKDSCAFSGYVNSIYTIAISGLNIDGSVPGYSESCAGLMAVAYSRDSIGDQSKVVGQQRNYYICFSANCQRYAKLNYNLVTFCALGYRHLTLRGTRGGGGGGARGGIIATPMRIFEILKRGLITLQC